MIAFPPKYTRVLSGLTVAAALMLSATSISAEENTQIGTLDCDVSGGVGLILGSKKDMSCVFKKKDGSVENYTGRVTKIGIDIGKTKKAELKWKVLAPSGKSEVGALAGKYDGVGAEATIAGGVGANALFSVGNNLTLQPISVQKQEGLNIAGGLQQMKLEYVK